MRSSTLLNVFVSALFIGFQGNAQRLPGLDKSPMDMAYFPPNFAHDRQVDNAVIRVTYSRPQKKGRDIFGKMVKYGKVWRTGANESTEIKLYQDIKMGGKSVKAGTYSLFTIPGEKSWEIILNTELDYWGSYSYNEDADVLRITVPASTSDEEVEAFTIAFEEGDDQSGQMILAWDKTLVRVPFKY